MRDCAPLFQITNIRGESEVSLTEPVLLHVEGMSVVSIARAEHGGFQITPTILATEPLRGRVLPSVISAMETVFSHLAATRGWDR